MEPSYINISISEDNDKIECTIRNSNYPKTRADKSGSGIGLEQVRKRLELVYPGIYKWDNHLSDDGKEYFSNIIIYLKH